jgi:hypothetical protein
MKTVMNRTASSSREPPPAVREICQLLLASGTVRLCLSVWTHPKTPTPFADFKFQCYVTHFFVLHAAQLKEISILDSWSTNNRQRPAARPVLFSPYVFPQARLSDFAKTPMHPGNSRLFGIALCTKSQHPCHRYKSDRIFRRNARRDIKRAIAVL